MGEQYIRKRLRVQPVAHALSVSGVKPRLAAFFMREIRNPDYLCYHLRLIRCCRGRAAIPFAI
ncbi:hypothetical protein EBA31_15270 [Serratia sp. P2ACOL2]|nr:hypothetical protein EBA31_15270 [Serratia sp. P2ACOL2]